MSLETSSLGAAPCDKLEVVRPGVERQVYQIFDHVTVYITVAESTAHGLGLRLELYAKPPKEASNKRGTKVLVNQPKPVSGDEGFKMRTDAEMIEVGMLTNDNLVN